MKTIKIKIKSLKSKMKDFIFNSTMQVKADIIWVKEKNKVFKWTKTTYEQILPNSF